MLVILPQRKRCLPNEASDLPFFLYPDFYPHGIPKRSPAGLCLSMFSNRELLSLPRPVWSPYFSASTRVQACPSFLYTCPESQKRWHPASYSDFPNPTRRTFHLRFAQLLPSQRDLRLKLWFSAGFVELHRAMVLNYRRSQKAEQDTEVLLPYLCDPGRRSGSKPSYHSHTTGLQRIPGER